MQIEMLRSPILESDRRAGWQTASSGRREPAAAPMLAFMSAVAALILGAGRGERLGHALPKAFVCLGGMTLLERSIRTLVEAEGIGRIQPVLAAEDFGRFKELSLQGLPGLVPPVEGGRERQDSVQAGLRSLPESVEWVAVHDAARCLVSVRDVERVVAAARDGGAAILAEPVRDTIKRVEQGRVVETPDRACCWAAQTPQVVRRDWLEQALAAATEAGRSATDDAQLVEWAGHTVRVIESSGPNPKITRPEDLAAATAILEHVGRTEGAAEGMERN